ncbi:hypothetical protein F2P81_001783 [Scophthalmus maximus]|uniref:Uncharacterized protein n=1 Tax=Scophthalmus maximus TaxID=52904 RepID=A0A6A4TPW1_SCOMX|nr:hypothetical protein F2P81_001783 [Scophthalmus maximus]
MHEMPSAEGRVEFRSDLGTRLQVRLERILFSCTMSERANRKRWTVNDGYNGVLLSTVLRLTAVVFLDEYESR